MEKETIIVCDKYYKEMIDAETKWRVEILYKIMYEFELQNQILANLMMNVIKRESVDIGVWGL